MPEERITVSEDKLYRALGELELRLVKSINDALERKAEQAQVDAHEKRLSDLEDSRLSRAHIETDVVALKPRVEKLEKESSDRAAVRRALRFSLVTGGLAFISTAADLAVIFGYVHH